MWLSKKINMIFEIIVCVLVFSSTFQRKKVKLLSSLRRQHLGRLSFFVRVHFSKTIKCIHLKLGILVHYQKRNQLQQADDPMICISRVICPYFDIVNRNLGYFFSIIFKVHQNNYSSKYRLE